VWTKLESGPKNSGNRALSVAAGTNGKAVNVTGENLGTTTPDASATIAYNATTSARLWKDYYPGANGRGDDSFAMAVSPVSRSVFVTGQGGFGSSVGTNYTTIAYRG
jgi:hypothetical protein